MSAPKLQTAVDVLIRLGRGYPPPGCALQKTALDEIGLVNVLYGPHLFGTGRGNGFDAHGSAAETADDVFQNLAVAVDPALMTALGVGDNLPSSKNTNAVILSFFFFIYFTIQTF